MITTSINIEPYLAEYLCGKYNQGLSGPFKIPDKTDLYHAIWDLMTTRRKDNPQIDTGNITLILPNRRIGKNPLYFNYLSQRSAKIIEKDVRRMFNRELHLIMDENDLNNHEYSNIDLVYRFLNAYHITSISADALLKNFYRWRDSVRKRGKRRKYTKKVKTNE